MSQATHNATVENDSVFASRPTTTRTVTFLAVFLFLMGIARSEEEGENRRAAEPEKKRASQKDKQRDRPTKKKRNDNTERERKKRPPKPERITRKTKDRVSLACTYYPGTKGKNSVPIIMVHGWTGGRGEFEDLALHLQEKFGHAVITVDLRGHGESNHRMTLDGGDVLIQPERMRRNEIAGMYEYDLEAIKSYLLAENNKGNLNIELLCVVGAELGAIVAMNWAVQDWSWPQLANYKQGQDVKALVLVSPTQAEKGLKVQPALKHPDVRALSTLIMVGGGDRKSNSYAKRLQTRLKKYHPPPSRDPRETARRRSLYFVAFDTSLQGTRLLDARVDANGGSPHDWIGEFIQRRLVRKQDEYPWKNRSSLLGG